MDQVSLLILSFSNAPSFCQAVRIAQLRQERAEQNREERQQELIRRIRAKNDRLSQVRVHVAKYAQTLF